ncbi:tetratricopeptide repeat protein [Marinoscillum sp.]|uniref:tetratricopeptide repeat protein n=1 Tax=Marinoscillum sp. TaxID=2024838 RepID=UPI003BABC3FE
MKPILILAMFCMASLLYAQSAATYVNQRDETHLCGPITISDLEAHGDWFHESYNDCTTELTNYKWKKSLKDTEVDIYLGTWCGDSKYWVPKFLHLWDDLGLDRNQLNFIALYDGQEKYKQGPNNEEAGLDIHRVPTFIFKENNKEYARIVEFPASDLVTDVAQIALGYPPEPSYRAATYLQSVLNEMSSEDLYKDVNAHFQKVYKVVGKSSELNTLGYVYLRSGRTEEALVAFHFNTYIYRHDPNVYDSYGEALMVAGDTTNAIANYEKVLELDPDNENAKKQLGLLGE